MKLCGAFPASKPIFQGILYFKTNHLVSLRVRLATGGLFIVMILAMAWMQVVLIQAHVLESFFDAARMNAHPNPMHPKLLSNLQQIHEFVNISRLSQKRSDLLALLAAFRGGPARFTKSSSGLARKQNLRAPWSWHKEGSGLPWLKQCPNLESVSPETSFCTA